MGGSFILRFMDFCAADNRARVTDMVKWRNVLPNGARKVKMVQTVKPDGPMRSVERTFARVVADWLFVQFVSWRP